MATSEKQECVTLKTFYKSLSPLYFLSAWAFLGLLRHDYNTPFCIPDILFIATAVFAAVYFGYLARRDRRVVGR